MTGISMGPKDLSIPLTKEFFIFMYQVMAESNHYLKDKSHSFRDNSTQLRLTQRAECADHGFLSER